MKEIEFQLKIMNKWLKDGWSLKNIYDEVVYYLGSLDGAAIFFEFAKQHKKNAKFMKEFNSTAF
ncbi:hypothetical protein ACQ1PF_09515 [Ornithobacterium rhinotracheale]|uniref:hypothetical protein n=1 Tax=Ornithobacterium rhinotracheale TaxID=28251 RepID=UPI001FF2CFE2|nr:hypothetical protein [Ornithobacterium rhinotracheale]MCK0201350.1 hypothetical protein [Ornithobacterium rhinotracheale]